MPAKVEAAFIFTAGANNDWLDFDIGEAEAMQLADWLAQDEPEPVPERARGFMATKYQTTLNWDAIKRDGYQYAMLRISGPNTSVDWTSIEVDPWLARHVAGAESVGLLKGGFHFLVPDLGGQAGVFAQGAAPYKWDLPLFCDVEAAGLDRERVDRFLGYADLRLTDAGVVYPELGIYTNLNLWGKLGPWDRTLWLAQWDVSEPSISGWTFWQHSGGPIPDGEYTSMDVYTGTPEQLYSAYGNGEEEPVDNITIVDRNGNPVEGMTWESVQADYGLSLHSADVPDGERVFRLVRLVYDDSFETNWRLYALDEEGRPLPGMAAFMGIQPPSGEDLPLNMAPLIAEGLCQQPEGRPNRALVLAPAENFTNLDGYIQHSLGAGSNYVPPGPGTHWAWVTGCEQGIYSDVPAGFGMWDEHKLFWPVFQLVITEDGEEPEPEPESDIAAQLARIGDILARIERDGLLIRTA